MKSYIGLYFYLLFRVCSIRSELQLHRLSAITVTILLVQLQLQLLFTLALKLRHVK